jgi:hypothetical protein
MPRPRLTLLLTLAIIASAHAEKPRKPIPASPAGTYAMHYTVGSVTIAAEPGDLAETRPNTRLDYFGHGMLPVRIIVTNNGDQPLTLDDARIHLITADNTILPAATLDELQRRLFTMASATGHKVPLPLPIPVPITVGKKNINKNILADDTDFGFPTTTVAPHTTVAGYLYYDMQTTDGDNSSTALLTHATLELRKVRYAADAGALSGQALDSFEIPLHPTAAPKP